MSISVAELSYSRREEASPTCMATRLPGVKARAGGKDANSAHQTRFNKAKCKKLLFTYVWQTLTAWRLESGSVQAKEQRSRHLQYRWGSNPRHETRWKDCWTTK